MLRKQLYNPWFADESHWGIEIIEGDYQGVVISIESMKLAQDDDPNGNFMIDYTIIKTPDFLSGEDLKTEVFKAVLTTIIEDIVREALEN